MAALLRSRLFYPALLFAVLLAFYGTLALLWANGSPLYENILALFSIGAVNPSGHWYAHDPLPFFDLAGVLSWGDCHALGRDVMALNPCDPQGRLMNYSPLLLDLHLERIGIRHALAAGLAMDAGFLAVLPLVLRPATAREFAACLLAGVSYCVFYALERANLDVLLFVAIAGACLLPQRRRAARLAFYAVSFVCGALKFYPFVLLSLTIRERPRRFLALVAAAMVLMGIFAAHYWHDLMRIPPLLPGFVYYTGMFGAALLPFGVQRELGLPLAGGILLMALFLALAAWNAARIAVLLRRTMPDVDWFAPRPALLLCGAVLVVGDFLCESAIDYRLIFLLLCLPGLLALHRDACGTPLSRTFFWALVAFFFILWNEPFRVGMDGLLTRLYGHDSEDGFPWQLPLAVFFLVREGLCWFEISVFGALILSFLRQLPSLRRGWSAFHRAGMPPRRTKIRYRSPS